MTDRSVLDLKAKIIARKVREGPSYIFCPVCESDADGFAVQGRFNDQGAYFIEKLICISDECRGQTSIDITGGFVG